jgi:hemolysin activation/secretion protein
MAFSMDSRKISSLNKRITIQLVIGVFSSYLLIFLFALPILFGILLASIPVLVAAQSASDLDRIQQQNDQIIQQQEQQLEFDRQQIEEQREQTVIEVPVTPSSQVPDSDPSLCFTIKTIDVLGVSIMDSELITNVTAPYANQCLNLERINELLKSLTTLYLDRGYVTSRAYLPQQDLSSGKLIIQIIEGVIEKIDKTDAGSISISTAFPGMKGEVLNLRDIEQGIEQINRLATNRVRMELIPGSVAGASNIRLINQPQSPWQGNLRVDNSGQKPTGEEQGRVYLSRDNLLGLNDFTSLSFQSDTESTATGKKSESLSLRYELPYGYWLFALDINDFEYANRVDGQSQVFDTSGTSKKQTLTVSRVIRRDQSGKTEVITALARKASRNFIEGVKLDTSSRNLGVGKLQIRHRENYSGNQSLQASLTYQKGLDMFGSPDALTSDAPQPEYTAWLGDVSYSKRFSWLDYGWSFASSLSLQYSEDNLFGSEQISIGSLYSVRGFKGESLSARAGAFWRNDLSILFPVAANRLKISGLTAYIGLDAGTISNEPDNPDNGEVLQGIATGFGLGSKYVSADFAYARVLQRPDSFTDDKENLNFSITFKF